MKKLRVEEVIVVEGKYDAVKLADLQAQLQGPLPEEGPLPMPR